jgi:hypothetical protein
MSPKNSEALYYHRVAGRTPRSNGGSTTLPGGLDRMVETFVGDLERAIEARVKQRLREVVQSLPADQTRGQTLAALRAAVGLPASPGVVTSAGRVPETVRARPGRCVGVITGGRRCGRAAPPGDPPLCSFCRATVALVNGATARVSITLTPPADPDAARPARIQIAAGPIIQQPMMEMSSRKERCKGVLLGGGSCRSRVMPPDELCPWCRALGVRTTEDRASTDPA